MIIRGECAARRRLSTSLISLLLVFPNFALCEELSFAERLFSHLKNPETKKYPGLLLPLARWAKFENHDLVLQLASDSLAEGDEAKFVRYLQKSLRENPDKLPAAQMLVQHYLDKGSYDDAWLNFDKLKKHFGSELQQYFSFRLENLGSTKTPSYEGENPLIKAYILVGRYLQAEFSLAPREELAKKLLKVYPRIFSPKVLTVVNLLLKGQVEQAQSMVIELQKEGVVNNRTVLLSRVIDFFMAENQEVELWSNYYMKGVSPSSASLYQLASLFEKFGYIRELHKLVNDWKKTAKEDDWAIINKFEVNLSKLPLNKGYGHGAHAAVLLERLKTNHNQALSWDQVNRLLYVDYTFLYRLLRDMDQTMKGSGKVSVSYIFEKSLSFSLTNAKDSTSVELLKSLSIKYHCLASKTKTAQKLAGSSVKLSKIFENYCRK